MRTRIFVTHRFAAVHRYPDAPNEVAYLRDLHRHMFHVRAEMDVFHDDREVEFLMCQSFVRGVCRDLGFALGVMSCERIAATIADALAAEYEQTRFRGISVEVSEDGENGAIVTL